MAFSFEHSIFYDGIGMSWAVWNYGRSEVNRTSVGQDLRHGHNLPLLTINDNTMGNQSELNQNEHND